jgi:nucleoside-diphosphate-sugar epimerase
MAGTSPDATGSSSGRALPETVIVIGASGFIGRNLIEHLKEKVPRLIAVSTSGVPISGVPGLAFARLDEADVGPEAVVVNLAAYRYDASAFAEAQSEILLRNVEILGRVYEFCVRKRISEVRLASSVGVYSADETDFNDTVPIDLNREPNAGELMYAWSKRIGEIYCRLFERKYLLNTVTFRLTNPYGPHDCRDAAKAHVVPAFIIRALTTSGPFVVRGNPDATRDFVFVGDVCEVIGRSLAWRGRNGAYNLGSGENITIRQLAKTVLELVGSDREIVAAGNPVSDVSARRCRNERLRADFEIARFVTLRTGLGPTIEWYRHAIVERC